MLIYGTKERLQRFRDSGKTSRPVHDVLSREYRILSEKKELFDLTSADEGILLLDAMDMEALRFFFQKGWTNIHLPVCGDILSLDSTDADAVLETKLRLCTDWQWHKQANRFRMLRGYLQHRSVTDALPSHIQLEHTSYCNARCIMCGHAIYGNKGAQHISEKMIDRMQSLLPTCELMVLHGYGEPLLTEHLDRLLEQYRKYEIEVTTNTNLSYLPRHVWEKLVLVAKHLRVSCDGVTKEIYEGIRPGLSFDNFLGNLEWIHQYAPEMELMMEVVIMRQNVAQIPQMVRFASEHGFSQINFNRLGSHPVLNNERDCLTYYPHLTAHFLREGIETAGKLGIRMFYPVEWLTGEENAERMEEEKRQAETLPFQMDQLPCQEEQRLIRTATLLRADDASLGQGACVCTGICDSLLGRTNIDLDGNVYTCCMNTLKKVGNLFEMDDREFYNAPALVRMREQFYQGKVPAYCDRCSYVMNQTLAFARVERKDRNHE